MTQLDALKRPFAEHELQHFQGRGGQTMTYVEDESVMDRLDEAFGFGNWQVHVEPIPVYEGVVKVRLGVLISDPDQWAWYEDFGYPNREGGEALKEAVSDGIRRCGRYLGIARDLYRRPTTQGRGGGRATTPAPASPQPRAMVTPPPSSGGLPEEPDWVMGQETPVAAAERVFADVRVEGGECPMHHLAWALKPGGIVKAGPRAGQTYEPFWACPSQDRPFCKEKPNKAWMARHEVAA